MAYRLKVGRPLAKSILRAGLDQIKRAASELEQNSNPHEGVHQARKAFKRMRALLLLIKPIIGRRAFARENRRYQRLGQRFSGARDIQALIETVQKLEAHYKLTEDGRASAAITDWLRKERSQAEQVLSGEHMTTGVKELAKARKSFSRLDIGEASPDQVVRGLKTGYRAGRKRFAKAYATDEDEDFHDWRKAVQRHWRHLQLVSSAWPEALQPRIDLAQELSQLLGDDHDLAVLGERIRGNSGAPQHDNMAEFLNLCRKRQTELRRLAKARGARLFGETPKAFRLRIANYWNTASQIIPLEDIAVDAGHGKGGPLRRGSSGKSKKGQAGKVVPIRKA